MNPRLHRWSAGAAIVAGVIAAAWIGLPQLREGDFWRQQASPGALTPSHAFIEAQCATCHVTLDSVPATQCIACHAAATALLQRQPTAFHASIGTCTECHTEHQGRERLRAPMDHETLARISLGQAKLEHRRPHEGLLDCSACHATKDRHQDLFGRDCAQCHATAQWTVARFRHPSPASRDCAQCHQAPPSHFMEHFAMVSQRVARREHARVTECYECHQTTSWNDIRGVGRYKHH